ncbi:Lrp/AsnC ligand binding domain-containing protein [Candidatus Bathyarchaeota archaeon]|nr:Lrp/AsnC ligand binding domain-containing protein [Candidatus Bathyarchaeota archaeon]
MGGAKAYMLIVTSVGKEHNVMKELKKIPGITSADVVYGEFDIIVKIEGSLAVIDEANAKIRKVPDVLRTVTLIAH